MFRCLMLFFIEKKVVIDQYLLFLQCYFLKLIRYYVFVGLNLLPIVVVNWCLSSNNNGMMPSSLIFPLSQQFPFEFYN